MPTDLVVAKQTPPSLEFSNDQIRLLGETVAKGCDQNELAFFLHVAKLKRLDPFTGQIHVVKRWDSTLGREKMTVQVGIDGFRVIAARTNDLAGIDDPEYDTEEDEHPNVARVTVYRYGRNDERIPYRATARWEEYAQTKKDGGLGPMWKKLPYLMLGKCAEALALRKAFPDELGGMYTNEEMDQAENEIQAERRTEKKKPVDVPQSKSAQQQTTQQHVVYGGMIENTKQTTNFLWVTVKGLGLVRVSQDKVDGDMVVDKEIKFRGVKLHNDTIGDFYDLQVLVDLGKPGEEEAARKAAEGAILPENGKEVVQKMVENGTVKPASEIQPPKTIGLKRAQRLYILCTNNKAKNNGFNEEEIKKILAVLPNPVEHLRDLETGLYEQFEKWATGEENFQDFWKDDEVLPS